MGSHSVSMYEYCDGGGHAFTPTSLPWLSGDLLILLDSNGASSSYGDAYGMLHHAGGRTFSSAGSSALSSNPPMCWFANQPITKLYSHVHKPLPFTSLGHLLHQRSFSADGKLLISTRIKGPPVALNARVSSTLYITVLYACILQYFVPALSIYLFTNN
jgi:hypothetical protein